MLFIDFDRGERGNMHNIKNYKATRHLVWPVIVLFFYLTVTLIIYFISIKTGREGVSIATFGSGDDGVMYWGQIKQLYSNPKIFIYGMTDTIYVPLMTFILTLVHVNDPIIIRFINWIILGMLLLGCYKIMNEILFVGTSTSRLDKSIMTDLSYEYISLFFCLYISLISNVTFSLYRDVWIYTGFIWCVYAGLKLINEFKIKYLFMYIFFIIWEYEFRKYAAFSLIFAGGIYYIYTKINKRIRKLLIVVFVLLFVLLYSFFRDLKFPIVNMSLADALNYREGVNALLYSSGGSDVNIKLDQSNVVLFLFAYLYSILFNIFGPLLWQAHSVQLMIITVGEGIPIIVMTIYIWKNRVMMKNRLLFIIINIYVWVLLISVTNKNLGTGTRLRVPAVILITLIYIYIKIKKKSVESNR